MSLDYAEDIPSDAPDFDCATVAQALAPLVRQPRRGATVLGLHGSWGAGKTTLMNALRRELAAAPDGGRAVFIEFNAWKFQDRQALWRALILQVVGELRRAAAQEVGAGVDEKKLKELEAALYRAFAVEEKGPWKVNWRTLIVEVISLLLSLVKIPLIGDVVKRSTGWLAGLFIGGGGDKKKKKDEGPVIDHDRVDRIASILERETTERHVEQVRSVEQFLTKFRDLMDEFTKAGRRAYVFIDDLDRCLPESALEIFESIKLFLDAPGSAYVVALDREVIRKGLAVKYGRQGEAVRGQALIDPDEYLEKTISLSFDLPRLSARDTDTLFAGIKLPVALTVAHKRLLVSGLGTNPRRLKRFLNTLAVHLYLAELAKAAGRPVDACLLPGGDPDHVLYFLKLLLIAYRYSGVFALAQEDDKLLGRLQQVSNTYEQAVAQNTPPAQARTARSKALEGELLLVQGLHDREEFWRLIREKPNLLQDKELVARLQNWFRYHP
jgi:hypothetical protein